MITRIVRLNIQPEKSSEFARIFQAHKNKIASFTGCHSLELMKDTQVDHVFYTLSIWENETFLEEYRKSEFFQTLWNQVKPFFAEKAQAFSMEKQGI